MTELDRLHGHLKRLHLYTIGQIIDDEAKTAAATQMSYVASLTRLIDAQVAAKCAAGKA